MSSLSFHYLSMAVHSTIQKNFMEQVKSSGLTSGQPKVLDYLRDHNGANQKEIAAACRRAGHRLLGLSLLPGHGSGVHRTLASRYHAGPSVL